MAAFQTHCNYDQRRRLRRAERRHPRRRPARRHRWAGKSLAFMDGTHGLLEASPLKPWRFMPKTSIP